MNFAEKLLNLIVPEGSIAVSWTGQASFAIKTSKGNILLIDPNLSDYVEENNAATCGLGFRRLMAPLFQPEELPNVMLFSSHEHEDHFDLPVITYYLKNTKSSIWCNQASADLLHEEYASSRQLHVMRKEQVLPFEDFTLTVTDCDHGAETPDAFGFLFDFGFVKVYYSGDTALTPDRLQVPLLAKPEIVLLPINGEFGNLNGTEAAKYSEMLHAEVCVPHHFYTYPLHGGDPREALKAFPVYAPNCELLFMTPGTFLMKGRE